MKKIESFKFWSHKILPLVYDDSLSYYEVLCKVMSKLNEVIEAINTLITGGISDYIAAIIKKIIGDAVYDAENERLVITLEIEGGED